MKKIYLIRHGKRKSYKEDTLLSEIGVKQAELTGKYLNKSQIDQIYASPLPRTQQTAEIISEILNLKFKTDERLKERLVWGDRKDETFEDFLKMWDRATVNRNYKPRNGDSSILSGKRLEKVLKEIPENTTSLVIAHAGIIGDYLLNNFPPDLLHFQRDPYFSVLHVEILECSITEIQIDKDKLNLKRVNDTSHLSTPLE